MDIYIRLSLNVLFLIFVIFENSEPSSLPEQLHTRYTGCYGTHDFQPRCDSPDTVIAVRGTWVGSKLATSGCPLESEVYNGMLVDAINESIPVNETECCNPNFETDCIFPKVHSDYIYQIRCTGLTNCSRASSVFWDQTQASSCPVSYQGQHLPETNYMYMEYYCIPKSRISQMTSNVAETTNLPHYLHNNGYPSNITSGTTYTTCSVTSEVCDVSIYVYTIDLRLVSSGVDCEQRVSIIVENQTILNWDCTSQTYFNITNHTVSNRHVIVGFTNHVTEDGGNLWIGFQASDGSYLRITCPEAAAPESACTAKPAALKDEKSASPLGVIVGAAVGVLVIVAIVASCLVWYCVFRKRGKTKQTDENQNKINKSKEDLNNSNEAAIPEILGVKSNALPPISHALFKTSRLHRNNSVSASDIQTSEFQQARLPPIELSQTVKSEKSKKRKKSKKEKRRKNKVSSIAGETNGILLPNQTMPNTEQEENVGFSNGVTIDSPNTGQSNV